MTNHVTGQYENNPFNIGLKGIQLLFRNAQSVGIFAAILAGLGVLFNTISNAVDLVNQSNESHTATHASSSAIDASSSMDIGIVIFALALVFLITLIVTVVSLLLYGVLEYTGARLALGEKVTLKGAFLAVWKNLLGYAWMYIIMVVKIFLWTLLLIVPGVIMSVRYSLASTVFFAENKRGNAAIKRSTELTKGAWFTTFAGSGLWNLITLGQISAIVNPSANAILYRQLRHATDNNLEKPAAHWLSWLTFFGPLALLVLFLGFMLFLFIAIFALAAA